MDSIPSPVEPTRSAVERALAWLAVACWLAAWVLPAAKGMQGWEAFQASLAAPFHERFGPSGEDAVPIELSALTNVAFAVMLLRWLRKRVLRPALFAKVALACFIIDCYWLVSALRSGDASGLRVGYYVWLAAFALLVAVGALSAVSGRRTSKTPTDGTPT